MTALQPLVIIGAGGHGREALDIVEAINSVEPRFRFLGFLDDGRPPGSVAVPHDAKVLGGLGAMEGLDAAYVPAVGATDLRKRIVTAMGDREAVSLVHPSASLGSHVAHGPGLIMGPGSRLTHGIELGRHVHLNVNATVSHDCRVGDFVTITPGVHISGGVTLGNGVWMGIGSSVIQGVTIGEDALIGAGAAVVADLPAGWTAVGVPAQPIKPRSEYV